MYFWIPEEEEILYLLYLLYPLYPYLLRWVASWGRRPAIGFASVPSRLAGDFDAKCYGKQALQPMGESAVVFGASPEYEKAEVQMAGESAAIGPGASPNYEEAEAQMERESAAFGPGASPDPDEAYALATASYSTDDPGSPPKCEVAVAEALRASCQTRRATWHYSVHLERGVTSFFS